MSTVLARWNAAVAAEAEAEIRPCNGSHTWAAELVARRPFVSEAALLATSDVLWSGLSVGDWQQAFDSHPRIGEGHARSATETSLRWSAGEQSALMADGAASAALAEANRIYEQRFGRIFLVCASGKSATEILRLLRARLGNEEQAELHEAAEQQRRITQLRLRKWLGQPAARCEDV